MVNSPANPKTLIWDDQEEPTRPASPGQCEQCRWAAEDVASVAANYRKAPVTPISRYEHRFGPIPVGVRKFAWHLGEQIEHACEIALQLGAPIRDWKFTWDRQSTESLLWGEPTPEPPPPVRSDDIYVRYFQRFGEAPARRITPPPPHDEPDQFDLGMEAALAKNRAVKDWQALVAPVRKVRPPTRCWLHDEDLVPGFGRISRIANIGRSLTQRHTPFANLRTGDRVDSDIDSEPEYPVAYCPACRAEIADWLKTTN